ncbi:TMAO reductase system periplasmic protein TorT [Pseudomonas sp. GV071]|jgi:protein TorT|uniref:TMAO reductase system periplasmic protein TorT n=1 Tax=Pseudomonas sp. GV071 TaxID=2135754 RepID=UPI000D381BA9|nr:TMAO reductase system periplasmic protein TorT [Pseudomonas sp. GV071]PTQ72830.1 monosaccharide ABC transporter substrate-binding protein (CUT2 family) [Pseudomonas sp. GV071]
MRVICLTLLALCGCLPVYGADWFPTAVVSDGNLLDYQPQPKASQPWRVCALLPQGKDRYWWGVSWGLAEEATRQGIQLGIYEAGGYQYADVQVAQLQRCIQRGADAVVIASINTTDLCPQIEALRNTAVPVIDLVNRLECAGVTAHSRVDFAEMAKVTVAYILDRHPGKPARVGWLPGPQNAGWVADAERGVQQAVAGSTLSLISGGYGPPDRASQAKLVRDLLQREPDLDYLLGNAEAAAFAAQLKRTTGTRYHYQVLSFYATEQLLALINKGEVLAAPTDAPVIQARIAIDLAVRALEKQPLPERIGPRIRMLDKASLQRFDMSLLMPPNGQWMIRQEMPD